MLILYLQILLTSAAWAFLFHILYRLKNKSFTNSPDLHFPDKNKTTLPMNNNPLGVMAGFTAILLILTAIIDQSGTIRLTPLSTLIICLFITPGFIYLAGINSRKPNPSESEDQLSDNQIYRYYSHADDMLIEFNIIKNDDFIFLAEPLPGEGFERPIRYFASAAEHPVLFNDENSLPPMLHLLVVCALEKFAGIHVSQHTAAVRDIIIDLLHIKSALSGLIDFCHYLGMPRLKNQLQSAMIQCDRVIKFQTSGENISVWLIPGGLSSELKSGFAEEINHFIDNARNTIKYVQRSFHRNPMIQLRFELPLYSGKKISGNPQLIWSRVINKIEAVSELITRTEQTLHRLLLETQPDDKPLKKAALSVKQQSVLFQFGNAEYSATAQKSGNGFLMTIPHPLTQIRKQQENADVVVHQEDLDLYIASSLTGLKGVYR